MRPLYPAFSVATNQTTTRLYRLSRFCWTVCCTLNLKIVNIEKCNLYWAINNKEWYEINIYQESLNILVIIMVQSAMCIDSKYMYILKECKVFVNIIFSEIVWVKVNSIDFTWVWWVKRDIMFTNMLCQNLLLAFILQYTLFCQNLG